MQPTPLPNFRAPIDIATGKVTYQGRVYSWYEWQLYTSSVIIGIHTALCQPLPGGCRDLTSDLQNLPGIKPWFHDDWFGWVPDQRPPDPRTDY